MRRRRRIKSAAGRSPLEGRAMAAIGQSVERVGGVDRVTGAQKYTADLRMDRVLQVKLISVDCAHARIKSIDTREALKVDGVRGIFSGADFGQPVPKFGPTFVDRPI